MPRASIAQPAPAATKAWTESASAGVTLTSGNKDTTTVNIGYEVTYDPKTRNLVRSDGLFLRGKSDGELTAERLGLNLRDEYKLTSAAFLFGQTQYVRDQFKNIEYLAATTGGFGVRVVETAETKLSADAGLGGVWEKNLDADVTTSSALTYSQKFTQVLSSTATLTQSLAGLHKAGDLGDALYTFNVAVAAALTARTQLKVELLDTYKSRIPATGVVKNDVAVLLALVYKN